MMMTFNFATDTEKNQHESAIEQLCGEYPQQSGNIRLLYEEELAEMMSDATIRSYLSIFISRKVRSKIDTGFDGHH